MTTEQMKYAKEGRDYWQQYVSINGYAFEPNEAGLKKLSKNLDLNRPYLRKCINAYLEM
jgi:hypothetical protein